VRAALAVGKGLGPGSAWLSCHDSSPWCDPYCHRSSASSARTVRQSEEQKVPGMRHSSYPHTDQRGLVLVRYLTLLPD